MASGPTRGALLLAGAVAASLVAGVPAHAAAQSDEDLERARTLFQEGVELTADERWSEAAERFREVRTVRDTTAVRYNLAVSLERMGEVTEAAELFRQVIADESFDAESRRESRRLLEQAERRMARISIRVEGVDGDIARIAMDGAELSAHQLSRSIPVDPGRHTVVAMIEQEVVDTETVDVGAGESTTVSLDATSQAVAGGDMALDPELAMSSDPEEESDDGGSIFGEWWFWTAIGAVVAATLIVVIAVSAGGSAVEGNLNPGILEVEL